jgi:threonine-phosphate decarboxylase
MLKHGGYTDPNIMDFSININPNIDGMMIESLLSNSYEAVHRYPQIEGEGLLELISKEEKIPKEHLILGNGATECLYACARALKAQTVLVIEPTFSEYRRAFEMSGSQVLSLKINCHEALQKTEITLANQIKKIKADVVVLCQPNNPTGASYSQEFISEIATIQSTHKGFVMVDESFIQFEEIPSCFDVKKWNLMVLMSLTKYYGVAGLRIGYIKGTKSVIMTMKEQQVPWTINGLVQKIMPQLIMNTDLKETTKSWYNCEKIYFEASLAQLSYLEALPSHGNFILCHMTQSKGSALNQWLLQREHPMAIRTCEEFEGLSDAYIRIGFKDHESNVKLMEALKAYEETMTNV